MRSLLVPLAALAIAQATSAADWWLVAVNLRTAMFVDRASLVRTGSTATQRVAAVTPGSPVRRVEVVEQIDCEARTARDLRILYVLAGGATVERTPDASTKAPRAGSFGRATLDFACSAERGHAAFGAPVGSAPLEEVALSATRGG